MHEDGIKILHLMFRNDETICVHHNQFAYHSIPLKHAYDDSVTMLPKDPRRPVEYVNSDDLLFVALNPINGLRNDDGCYKFRNFLVEMDTGPLDQQMRYIQDIGLPYSAAIFSGGKSLHFLVSLDTDLPNIEMYRMFAEWLLKAITLADPNTKNPSRSIRIPGAYRPGAQQQELYDYKGPVKMSDFVEWLKRHPEARPLPAQKRGVHDEAKFDSIKPWVIDALLNGLDRNKSRNKQWFAIACEFALNGYSEYDTIEKLSNYFISEPDFKEREWKSAIKSGFKYIYGNKENRKKNEQA